MSNTVKILYAGNFSDVKYLPLRPVKTFKRAGLAKEKIQPVLMGTLEVSHRACMVTCVDGQVTKLTNYQRIGKALSVMSIE